MNKIILISTCLFAITLSSCATSGINATTGIKSYTSKVCIVTDNKLGSMGTPVTKVYDGQEVKFCCAPCVKRFEANPAKYLSKL